MHSAKIMSEVITELSRVSFPPYDIMLRVAVSLLSMEQTRGMRSRTDGRVVPSGSPKYVKGIFPTVHPKILEISLVFAVESLIAMIVDLSKFIFKPMDVS